jgi:hypothetical protein
MPNAYYLVLEANHQKLTLRVSLPAQEAKHSARRPGLGVPFAFDTSVDLQKEKEILQCSLNYNYITQAPPIPILTYRVKKKVPVTF